MTPRFAWWIGGMLGHWFAHYAPGRDQKRCCTHLRKAFPEKSERWIQSTAAKTFRHFGRMVFWSLATLDEPAEKLRKHLAIEGRENLLATMRRLRAGKGVMVFSGHLGNWELMARLVGSVLPVTVLGVRLKDPIQNDIIVNMRTATGSKMVYQDDGVMACVRELRNGRAMATLPDQDISRLAGCFVPWFGHLAYTPTGPALVAKLGRAPVQTWYGIWRGDRWAFHVGPLWELPNTGDRDHDAAIIMAKTMAYQEALLRSAPWQWAWWHKRWRNTPETRPDAFIYRGEEL